MKYYISDLHFGNEKALKIDHIYHIGIKERNKMIVERWNGVVKDTDEVYIVGDVMCGSDETAAIGILKRLNGKKHLIFGNHDVSDATEFISCFESVDKHRSIIDDEEKCFCLITPYCFIPVSIKTGI